MGDKVPNGIAKLSMNRLSRVLIPCGLLVALGIGAFFIARSYARYEANLIIADLRMLDGATDQYVIENGKTSYELASWEACKIYLKPGSRLYRSEGNDPLGHPYILSPSYEGDSSVDARTVDALSWAVDPNLLVPANADQHNTRPPALIAAARRGDVKRLRELLKHGENIDQVDMFGRTALSWAAELGYTETVRVICSFHPHPVQAIKALDYQSRGTPIDYAVRKGHRDIITLFLDYGASVDPNFLELGNRSSTMVLRLLLARGMALNVPAQGGSLLLKATFWGNVDAVRDLITAGADVNAKKSNGQTVLQVADQNSHHEIAALLRASGARD